MTSVQNAGEACICQGGRKEDHHEGCSLKYVLRRCTTQIPLTNKLVFNPSAIDSQYEVCILIDGLHCSGDG